MTHPRQLLHVFQLIGSRDEQEGDEVGVDAAAVWCASVEEFPPKFYAEPVASGRELRGITPALYNEPFQLYHSRCVDAAAGMPYLSACAGEPFWRNSSPIAHVDDYFVSGSVSIFRYGPITIVPLLYFTLMLFSVFWN